MSDFYVDDGVISIASVDKAVQLAREAKGNFAFNDSTLKRALGIHWRVESDTFRFCIVLKDQPEMRCGILSIVASV